MTRLAADLARLAERGRHADPRDVVARALGPDTVVVLSPVGAPTGERRRVVMAMTAALAAAALIVALFVVSNRGSGNDELNATPLNEMRARSERGAPADEQAGGATTVLSGTSPAATVTDGTAPEASVVETTSAAMSDTTDIGATATTAGGTFPTASTPLSVPLLDPLATLPDSSDLSESPVSVEGSAPEQWVRLAPDLDVAWYDDTATGVSMVCFRTPAFNACEPDDNLGFANPDGGLAGIATAGGQVLVVIASSESPPDSWTIITRSGAAETAPVVSDNVVGWGVARFDVSATDLADDMHIYAPGSAGPGQSLPTTAADDTAPPEDTEVAATTSP